MFLHLVPGVGVADQRVGIDLFLGEATIEADPAGVGPTKTIEALTRVGEQKVHLMNGCVQPADCLARRSKISRCASRFPATTVMSLAWKR